MKLLIIFLLHYCVFITSLCDVRAAYDVTVSRNLILSSVPSELRLSSSGQNMYSSTEYTVQTNVKSATELKI